MPIAAMAGAAIAVALLLGLAGRDAGPFTLILAGVAVNAFAGALISLALNLAPSPYAVIEAVFWLLGSLADRSFTHVWISLPLTLVGWLLLATAARPLNALSLGDDVARSLGSTCPGSAARSFLAPRAVSGQASPSAVQSGLWVSSSHICCDRLSVTNRVAS